MSARVQTFEYCTLVTQQQLFLDKKGQKRTKDKGQKRLIHIM